uniref:Uncharacterized protein n=1 Tax=Hemiselmis tepida TaxID=464990 RepID=A0A7S0Z198_9CRYP|mmetsp:Transcript_38260/g.97836  ORF Transcript_38260/g.97836 Transcript_38260/m.97836 type:complete len:269 (+) Transcript_38260:55-861(+)
MRVQRLWQFATRLAPRAARRAESRGMAGKETTISRHNTLLEGVAKRGGPAAKYAQAKMEASGASPSRGAEAAYFYSDDNYKVRKMAGLDTSVEAMHKPYEPEVMEDPVVVRRDRRRAMVDEEFAEFDGESVPASLKIKVAGVKERALNLLEKTTMEEQEGHRLDKDMEEQLFAVDRKLVRTVRRIELGVPDAPAADEEERHVQRWGPRMRDADIAQFGVLLFAASCSCVAFKVATDPQHTAAARHDLRWLVLALEAAGVVPVASSAAA